MALYRAEGIVLRTVDLGEADRIVTLFSREEGKVRAVAKGSRRLKSRFRAAVQPFSHSRFLIYRGRSSLETLSQGEVCESFRGVREDLAATAHASYACELVNELTREHDRHEEVFLLLLATLHLLAACEGLESVIGSFELKLLSMVGFRPQLERCCGCGAAIAGDTPAGDPVRFAPAAGGLLCEGCGAVDPRAFRISRGAARTIGRLLECDLKRAGAVKMVPGVAEEVERALDAYIAERLEKRPKSLSFLRLMRAGAFPDGNGRGRG